MTGGWHLWMPPYFILCASFYDLIFTSNTKNIMFTRCDRLCEDGLAEWRILQMGCRSAHWSGIWDHVTSSWPNRTCYLQINFLVRSEIQENFDILLVQVWPAESRAPNLYFTRAPNSGDLKSRPFEIWTFWKLDFKWSGLQMVGVCYGYSPNHSKPRPFKTRTFLSRFQMVFNKMAALSRFQMVGLLDFRSHT